MSFSRQLFPSNSGSGGSGAQGSQGATGTSGEVGPASGSGGFSFYFNYTQTNKEIASSIDGLNLVATVNGGYIYTGVFS